MFSESGTQTLWVTITPHEEVQCIQFLVLAHGDPELVNAKIIFPTTGVDNEGRDLFVHIAPVVEPAYTIKIEIEIDLTPNAGTIEFMPRVDAWTIEATTIEPTTVVGDSVSYDSDINSEGGVGEWTWGAAPFDGDYVWQTNEAYHRMVGLEGYCERNAVWLRFGTHYHYSHDDDSFINHEVPGSRGWSTTLSNLLFGSEGEIANTTVGLETEMEFTSYTREGLVTDPPPPYEWSYNGIGPGAKAVADVGFQPDLSPVPFVPGYNASRTFDVTRFDTPGLQTLTIEVTPQEEMPPWFGIHVYIPQDIPFNASIESCAGADDWYILNEGQHLQLSENFEEYPKDVYNYTIEILVEPGNHPVEFWPDVEILTFPVANFPIISEVVDSSYSYPYADGMGTWTWQFRDAEGDPVEYPLRVYEQIASHVSWEGQAAEFINEAMVLFQTFWTHIASGDEFVLVYDDDGNPVVVPGNISWATQILNSPDNTGEPLSSVTLELATETEEEFDRVIPPVSGPPYQWYYQYIPNGDIRGASVSFIDNTTEFNPGFDASWSANTEFSAGPEPGTQVLEINVTPTLEFVDMVLIDVFAQKDDNVDPKIIRVEGADGAFLNQDGHRLMIVKGTPNKDDMYTVTVIIEVTPKVPQVKYRPTVRIYDPGFSSDGGEFESSFTHEMPGVGTWTCSADEGYQWSWAEGTARAVVFPRDSEVVITEFSIEHMSVDFDNLRPDRDRIAISEATITLGEAAAYNLTADDVVVNIDGVVITIPAGSFVWDAKKASWKFKSAKGDEPKIDMSLDFEKGEWSLKVDKVDASAIDNSDGVEITLTIGALSATEVINMQVGGLTFIAGQ